MYLNDEGGELVTHVKVVVVAASLAARVDDAPLGVDLQNGLGVLAAFAEDEPLKKKRSVCKTQIILISYFELF